MNQFKPEVVACFIPFSERNRQLLKSGELKLHICEKARKQIYTLFKENNRVVYTKTNKNGELRDVMITDCVLDDIQKNYTPKRYTKNGELYKAGRMRGLIQKGFQSSVFDAIEFYALYCMETDFENRINMIFKLNAIDYQLMNGQLKRTVESSLGQKALAEIPEKGLKDLVADAENYYRDENKPIAAEKLWDAFERLKTYYSPKLDKKKSASKVIATMSHEEPHFQKLYEDEFKALTEIGNGFRIRHHETTQTDITDNRQYEYFYQRCHALVSTAILYLEESVKNEAE